MPTWIGAPACGGGGSRVPRPVPQSRRLRVHLPRRDLLQGPRERAGGLPAVVVVNAVRADGHREVLGFDIGDSEDGAFWTAFLRSLNARGLHAVELGISDAHEGLNAAINAVFAGAAWQRCRVHFLRNVPTRVPRGNAEMVAAAIRTIFAPARRRARPLPARHDRHHARPPVPERGDYAGRARRPPGLRLFPGRVMEGGLVHQPS